MDCHWPQVAISASGGLLISHPHTSILNSEWCKGFHKPDYKVFDLFKDHYLLGKEVMFSVTVVCCLSVFLSVCLLATLLNIPDCNEILWRGPGW